MENERNRPNCPLIGQDGNVFNLIGIASRTLKENGMSEEAKEMSSRVFASGSYDEALSIIGQYFNITFSEEMDGDIEKDFGMEISQKMLFMNTPYWRGVEREMQTVPNFKPRRSGFQVNGVTLNRFRDYKNAAVKLLYSWKHNDVTKRITAMYKKSCSFFADSDHEKYFREFIENNHFGGSRFYAAVFLLSAEFDLRKRLETAIINGAVNFRKINLKGISADGYITYIKRQKQFIQAIRKSLRQSFLTKSLRTI